MENSNNCLTLLSDLLQTASHLKLLIIPRGRLHLQGEWVFEMRGLPLPLLQLDQDFEDNSAINLFIQQARRVRHDFRLTPAERPAVAHIGRLVDGLPLGLELAAAWTHVLSCLDKSCLSSLVMVAMRFIREKGFGVTFFRGTMAGVSTHSIRSGILKANQSSDW